MGPLFGRKEGTYFLVVGSASRLSFGGTASFTLAVQFCPTQLPGQLHFCPTQLQGSSLGAPSAAGSGHDGTMTLLSKFHKDLRGEYRIGLDASLRPFFHREVCYAWCSLFLCHCPCSCNPNRCQRMVLQVSLACHLMVQCHGSAGRTL